MGILLNHRYFYTYRFLKRWKLWAIISFPIILLPVMIVPHFVPEAKCAYVMLLVMCYWIFNVIPLAITAVLPVALLPILGIMPSNKITPAYMKDINMLMIVVMVSAVGVEYSNLHRRMALRILLLLGTKPRWLFMGFMSTTLFLSMWINNTSSTAMMTPIADSVLIEMYPFENPEDTEEERLRKKPSDPALVKEAYNIRNGILLCICGGANIGGTGTMMGTGSNLVLANTVEAAFPDGEVVINYVLWMAFCIPNLIICASLMWLVFQLQFMGVKATFNRKPFRGTEGNELKTKLILQQKYKDLGPLSYHEATVLVIFIILIILWIFREPGFMSGWQIWINNKVRVKDSAAAVLAATLMFALPTTPDWWWSDVKDGQLDPPAPRCVTWEVVHARLTWSVLFILGGGFALAEACKVSGLSSVLAGWLMVLEGTSPILLCFLVMLVTVSVTSVTSNTATSTILLPIMVELADAMKIAPLFLLLPTTLSCSFSFLLPISTPPNAIVFERSTMAISTMAKTGFCLAAVCMLTTTFMITFYAPFVFDFDVYSHPHYPKHQH